MPGAVLDCSLRSLGSAQEAAYLVVTCRRKACRLAPPQHGGRDPLWRRRLDWRGDAKRRETGLVTSCAHLDANPMTPLPSNFQAACSDCLAVGGRWVHLRRCLTCDHVGCCDSSPARHASNHAQVSGHPVVTSVEPGEHWRWCYFDKVGT